MKQSKIILALFIGQIFWLFCSTNSFSQPQKLDIIEYTLLKGWAKTPKEGVTVYSYV